MPRPKISALLLTALIATAVTFGAAPAEAGTYLQHTCRLSDGRAAAADGWVAPETRAGFESFDQCASHAGLRLVMQRGLSTNSRYSWRWTAPDDTVLTAVELFRAFELAEGDGTASPNVRMDAGALTLENATSSVSLGNGIARAGQLVPWNDVVNNRLAVSDNPGLAANQLTVSLACVGDPEAACPTTGTTTSSMVHIHAATFTLADDSAPAITAVGGSLTTIGDKRGVETVSISATDTGGGIYRTITSVDGTPVASATPDANGGKCVDAMPANSTPHEYQHQVPCPLRLDDIPVQLDTRALSDGPHLVHVEVEDAAGNRTSAFGPTMVSVRNAAAPVGAPAPDRSGAAPATGSAGAAAVAATAPTTNGAGGGPGARLSVVVVQSKQRVVNAAHGRSVTLSGRLVSQSGAPVSGASIEILAQTRLRGAAMRPLATVRTDGAGRFRFVLRPGPSRLVRFGYRAWVGDPAFSASTDLDVRVKAEVSLRLSSTRVRNGKTLLYTGRIAGQSLRRPLVQIQVRNGARWTTVCVVRTRTGGDFRCRYRFRRTFRPTTYTFRALARKQDGLPYETAASPRRSVRVVP